jgi:cell wall-associated NlpC family hydrolase
MIVAGTPAVASASKTRAIAAATGGTTAASTTTSKESSTATGGSNFHRKTAKRIGLHAPITATRRRLGYKGHIYEELPGGTLTIYTPPQPTNTVMGATGGDPVGATADIRPRLLVPGSTAVMLEEGQAAAPENAPKAVKEMIWAANEIVGKPYIYGGGHASFISPGYDCSGTVSYALHGAKLIETPMDSSEMEGWGEAGIGRWVTVFANPGHAYMTIAGLRLDTSPVEDPAGLEGPRWRPLRRWNPGFARRHPEGL